MKITKSIDKILKQIAAKLPETGTFYDSFGYEEIDNNDLKKARLSNLINDTPDCNPEIMTDRRKFVKVPKQRLWTVNHLRRLRKSYEKSGEQGVRDYIEFVNKQTKQIDDAIDRLIVNNLVKETIKPIL